MSEVLKDQFRLLKKEGTLKKKKTAIALSVTTQLFNNEVKIFPFRYFQNYVCLPIGIKNTKTGIKLAKFFDGKVDLIFVDSENKIKNCKDVLMKIQKIPHKSKIYGIKGNDFSADSTYAILCNLLGIMSRKKICIIGVGNIGSKVALKLIESGNNVLIINSSRSSSVRTAKALNILKPIECSSFAIPTTKKNLPLGIDCIIGFTRGIPVITKEIISHLKKDGLVFDGGSGTITADGIKFAKKKGMRVLKLDIRMGFIANVELILNSEKLMSEIYGKRKIKNFCIVAGGFLGNKGDVVVDKIVKPDQILGIADGCGFLLDNSSFYQKRIKIVQDLIKNQSI